MPSSMENLRKGPGLAMGRSATANVSPETLALTSFDAGEIYRLVVRKAKSKAADPELTHVEQYRQLGIPRFSDLYV